MESLCSPTTISTVKKIPLWPRTTKPGDVSASAVIKCSSGFCPVNSSVSYKKFIHFALEEANKHTDLSPSSLQDSFSHLTSLDEKSDLQMLSFESSKIRLLRSFYVEGNDGMQVLDFAVFPRPEFDLPIFCANFFTTTNTNIVVFWLFIESLDTLRDLNPLHDVICKKDYKEKYYKHLISLGLKYAEMFPWGGKLTAESLKFFSPIVIWTKFNPSMHKHYALYSAFRDYLKAWLELMSKATGETNLHQTTFNLETQHRYLTWRAEKDPGHQLLRRLVGETLAKKILRSFLFNGVDDLGNKTFLDYFPEYMCDDGTINQKRSVIGKSFETCPWDSTGEFIGDSVR